MAMNLLHRVLCRSTIWSRHVERELLPWALDGVELGARAVEIGAGYGANLPGLARGTRELTAVEIDAELAGQLRLRYGDVAEVIHADGTATGLPGERFDSVVCFTMLHHIPTAGSQDRLFAEAYRLLAPGGVFAGSDGVHRLGFRLIHVGDVYNPVDPDLLTGRLEQVGFTGIAVDVRGRHLRFRARKRG